MKMSFWKVCVLGVLAMAGGFAGHAKAQEEPSAPPRKEEKVRPAYVRYFADLGERRGPVRWSLGYRVKTQEGEKVEALFRKANGGRATLPTSRSLRFPAGEYLFSLARDGSGENVTARVNMKPDGVYTILAMVDDEGPILRIIKEHPLGDDESGPQGAGLAQPVINEPGLVVHHIRNKQALTIRIEREGAERVVQVPFSKRESFFLPPAQIDGEMHAELLIDEHRKERFAIPYLSGERMIMVFFRDGYGQSMVDTFSVMPEDE